MQDNVRQEILRAIEATCRRITESNNGYSCAQDAAAVQTLVEALRALPASVSPVECIKGLQDICRERDTCEGCPVGDWCEVYVTPAVIPEDWETGGVQA